MRSRFTPYFAIIIASLVTTVSTNAFAEDIPTTNPDSPAPAPSEQQDQAQTTQEAANSEENITPTKEKPVAPAAQEEATKNLVEEKNKKSDDGIYQYSPSFGAGAELGFWFSNLDRFGELVFNQNHQRSRTHQYENFRHSGNSDPDGKSSIIGNWNLDLAAETSFVKGLRLTLFGGVQSPVVSKPSSWAFYGGIEPAFAFRSSYWEFAIGSGFGFGGVKMTAADSFNPKPEAHNERTFSATFAMIRPFLEVRHYFNDWFALYGRLGYNQWLVTSHSSSGLQPADNSDQSEHIHASNKRVRPKNLDEGQLYLSLGVRFGFYGEPISEIGDRDGDGYKDDVDQCPDDPEDFDGFEDEDGCPDPDNDQDGILDKDDKCPLDPEDKDGFEDEDGCPDPDNDKDGILDKVDKCPDDPEDFDGIGDDDGCPETDYDNDGVLDEVDKCPTVPGVAAKQGCPYEKVRITLDQIQILDKVFFAYNKATIRSKSYKLLDDVARTIIAYPRIKKLEIGGHTDTKGPDKYNKKLSQQRAEAVLKYLVKRCIDPERLVAVGYGEEHLLIPPGPDGKETKENAEKNRRVEFKILEQETVSQEIDEEKLEKLKKEGQLSEVSKDGKLIKLKGSLSSKKQKPCVFK